MHDTEYNPAALFDEYVERLKENIDDPELRVIEAILREMRYEIRIPEEEKREVPRKRVKNFRFLVANIYLVNSDGEVEYLSRQTLITTPEPLKFDPQPSSVIDRKFLKEAEISW